MKCKNCGREIDATKMKFCMYCGAVIEPEMQQKVSCIRCGYEFKDNEKFCAKCGTPREAKPDSINPVKANNVVQPEKKPIQSTQFERKQESSSGFKLFDKSTIIISIICVIGYLVIQNFNKKSNTTSSSSTPSTQVETTSSSDTKDEIPSWLTYGNWVGMSPFGSTELVIRGKSVTFRMGTETQYGEVSYYDKEKQILFTTFCLFEVDPSTHRVSAGRGYWMIEN